MWPPPNMQSVPSKEEIQSFKEAISIIELEIIETELRLDALRKSLFERKAWIAPIRKTPHEILSLIFIEASRTDWKAPLLLQSVSRLWRDVAVDSPGMWTFIPLSKSNSTYQPDLISLFLARSRNWPLHVSVEDDSLLRYVELLRGRIKCIHLKPVKRVTLNHYLQRGHAFHRLERLKIDVWDWYRDTQPTDDLEAWDMLLFPNLKFLDIRSHSSSLLGAISAAPKFPAIQHLIVHCWEPRRLLDILTKCATLVESVDLIYNTGDFEGLDTEHDIHFPHLRCLRLADWSDETGFCFRFKATTPHLQAYLDDGNASTLNAVRVDTGSVILLHVSHTPDLSQYPRLVTLCFGETDGQGAELVQVIEWLSEDPSICPDLALIEYIRDLTQGQLVRASFALLARESVTGKMIQLMKGTAEAREERAQTFRAVEPCGDHMPCSLFNYPEEFDV